MKIVTTIGLDIAKQVFRCMDRTSRDVRMEFNLEKSSGFFRDKFDVVDFVAVRAQTINKDQ